MKKYIGAALSITTVGLLFYTLFDLKEQVKQVLVLQHQVDSLTVIKDSLINEVFVLGVTNGRYEITLDHLQETHPKAALEFVNYMNHETE